MNWKYKLLIAIVAFLMLLPVAGYFVLQNSHVQRMLVNKITTKLSGHFNTEFRINGVDIRLFKSVVLEQVYLEDQQNDTLLYAQKLDARISTLQPLRRTIKFDRILLQKPRVNLKQDSSSRNFDFILKALASDEPSTNASGNFSLFCNDFTLEDAHLSYKSERHDSIAGFDAGNFTLSDIDLAISDIEIGEKTRFTMEDLSLKSPAHMNINNLLFKASLGPQEKRLEDMVLLTDKSNVILREFVWQQTNDTSGGFWNANKLRAYIADGSFIDGNELSYFLSDSLPPLKNLELSGKLGINRDSAYAEKLRLTYGNSNHLIADGKVKGFMHEDSLRGDVRINQLLLQTRDILARVKPYLPDSTVKTLQKTEPGNFLAFRGRVKGTLHDIHLLGKFRSEAGTLDSDLRVKRSPEGKFQWLDGKLNVNKLKLGQLLQNPAMGTLTMKSSFNRLNMEKPGRSGSFHVTVNQVGYAGNSFEGLRAKGQFNGDALNLEASMQDTTLDFTLSSKILLKETPIYRLGLHLEKSDFAKTGLDTKAETSWLKMDLNAYLKGNSLGDISGDMRITDAVFKRDTHRVAINSLTLTAMQSAFKQKSLTLNSPFFDMKLNGRFDYKETPKALRGYLHGIFPRAVDIPAGAHANIKSEQRFRYNLSFKDINPLLQALRLNSSIAPGSVISGRFSNLDHHLELDFESEHLNAFGNEIEQIDLYSEGDANSLTLTMQNSLLSAGGVARFDNFRLALRAQSDSLLMQANWDNPEDAATDYSGEIKSTAYFRELKKADGLRFNINIHPSYFAVADTVWNIQPTQAIIDTAQIEISPFKIIHKNEYLSIGGKLSKNPSDTLYARLNNFQLANLNVLLKKTSAHLAGKMGGQIAVSNVYKSPFVHVKQQIQNLTLNGQYLGNLNMDAGYMAGRNLVELHTYIQERSIKNFQIKGAYNMATDTMFFGLDMKNLSLNLFNPFLQGNVSGIGGLATTDNIRISGNPGAPEISGDIFLQKTGFKIDYLNTRYTFTDSLSFSKNSIVLNALELHDKRNNTATLNGRIAHNNFQDIELNINASLKNFKALNTTSEDNELFYGEAYTTGVISVMGPVDDLVVDVSARTEPKTRFFIPLSSGGEISENNFITFASDTSSAQDTALVTGAYETDVTGIQLNFDLEVTPEASIALILDENSGDVLRSRGNGALRMVIDTRGQFNMYGDYNIQQGDYVFTLQNVVKRKFDIREGSSIKWDGSPYNAQLDIKTVYTVSNAKLYDLTLQNKYKETQVPAQCIIVLEDELTAPAIDFRVQIDDSYEGYAETEQIKAQLDNLPEQELNKQFLSLLIISRFQPLPGFTSAQGNIASNTDVGLSSSASEVLTNQLSSWISQISDDFNVGLNYNTSDSLSSSELEVALSTQLLNDRVRINGNLNMGDEYTRPENYFGNFDVEYKITKNGKLRAKYYNKANNDLIYDESPTKQGLGLFYHEDFDTFPSLVDRYKTGLQKFWNKLFNKEENN